MFTSLLIQGRRVLTNHSRSQIALKGSTKGRELCKDSANERYWYRPRALRDRQVWEEKQQTSDGARTLKIEGTPQSLGQQAASSSYSQIPSQHSLYSFYVT